jgi:hypothetical protein
MTKCCADFLLNRDPYFGKAGTLSAAVLGFVERSSACAPTVQIRSAREGGSRGCRSVVLRQQGASTVALARLDLVRLIWAA